MWAMSDTESAPEGTNTGPSVNEAGEAELARRDEQTSDHENAAAEASHAQEAEQPQTQDTAQDQGNTVQVNPPQQQPGASDQPEAQSKSSRKS